MNDNKSKNNKTVNSNCDKDYAKAYACETSEGNVSTADSCSQTDGIAPADSYSPADSTFLAGVRSSAGSSLPIVALVKCCSYEQQEVNAAVARAVELLGGFKDILSQDGIDAKDSLLILKPNLLSKAIPEKAVTTHPAVFSAAGRALQEAGYTNLKYGDSPGNPMIKVEKTAEECGIKAVADSMGIPIGQFEHGTQVEFPQGRAADKFVLCDEVIAADGIINLCKMKTHQLERITGAVKNTFGCVYGFNKGAAHAQFATAEVFGRMIADLNRLVRPKLHIMDGITAMEGNGPASGVPKQMNVILASTDPVALDGLFCYLINLRPELVPTNVSAMEQGVGSYENIQVMTDDGILTAEEAAALYGDKSFSVQRGAEYRGALGPVRFLAPFLEKKPVVKKDKCIGCGICSKVCPVDGKAIKIVSEAGIAASGGGHSRRSSASTGGDKKIARGIAVYDYSRCIKCYCCQEMCPEEAITVKKSLLARIADRNWRI